MVAETGSDNGSDAWKKFFRMHWNMVVVFAVVAVVLMVGAVLVGLWFVGDAQLTDLVPTTLRLWTMGHFVTFLLHLIFWEILFIGIPAILAAVVGWLWWKRLPEEERKTYHFFGTRSQVTGGGGGGISLLHFIVFCIKVYTDGNWNVAIATWTFDYLVYSCLWALIWILIIFGIPIALGVLWWINHEMKKKT
ncbi:MAG: hypothetical protein JSV51_08435 [Candidatus Bathyarchaeota archaeon]|nr:MAG: hypothetical protein JSV51_08435 [Candidatus Bathyarchaeota archaeon]